MAQQISLEARRERLQAEVARLTGDGWWVVHQSDTTAQLRKPKRFSFFWAIAWLILGLGVGVFVYVAWYLAKREQTRYLRVDEQGRVVG